MKNPYIFSTYDPLYPILLIDYLSHFYYHNNKNKKILIVTDDIFLSLDKNTSIISLDDYSYNKKCNNIVINSNNFKKTIDFVVNCIKLLKKKNNLIILYELNDKSINITIINNFLNIMGENFEGFIIKKNNQIDHILFKFINFKHNNKNIFDKINLSEIKTTNDYKNIFGKKTKINQIELLKNKINIGKKYNCVINPYYEDLINNFTLRLKQEFYSSEKSIFLSFDGQLKLNKYDFNIQNECEIDNFKNIYDVFIKNKTLRNSLLLEQNKDDFFFKKTKINRNYLPKYLHQKFFHKYTQKPFNNAFLKLFEILNEVSLLKKKKHYVTIHLAELPGGFIYATNAIINKISDDAKHIWYGNSYNPKIIKEGFDDGYGLVNKYPEKWLWGKDGTGDLTIVENIEHIKKNIKESHIDFITLDGGLSADNELVKIQKLDYAQMLVIAMLSTKGTDCVVKTFANFIFSFPQSINSIGLYIDILLIYSAMFEDINLIKPPNSSANSFEFYIVGKNFISLDNDILDKLKDHMNNFEENKCFLLKEQREKIKEITINIYKFYSMIIQINNDELNKQIFMLSCEKIDKNNPFYNNKFIDESYSFIKDNKAMYKIGLQKAIIWCKNYNVDNNIKITI